MNAQVLSQSFQAIKPQSMAFAQRFYDKLFEKSAEVRQLFASTNMQEQCRALVAALAFVVVGVTENKDIREDLTSLGARHKSYGVKPAHYALVGESLIETLREYFGSQWTQEMETTWIDAYEVVSSIMKVAPEP